MGTDPQTQPRSSHYCVYVQLFAQPTLSQDLNNNNRISTVANLVDSMQMLGQIQAMENSPMATFSMEMCQHTKSTNLDGIGDIPTIASHVMNKARTTDSAPGSVGETHMTVTVNTIGNTTMDPANTKPHPSKSTTLHLTK